MKTLLNSLLKRRYPKRRSPSPKSTSGFTMIELLVATIVATIIIVPILTFVVDILNRDVREQVKTNSEKELQSAVDYITQDMSQAIYIYDLNKDGKTEEEKTAIDNFIAQLPSNEDTDGGDIEPILVFWKRKFVENALGPSGGICTDTTPPICNDAFVFSLVAYYLRKDKGDIWCVPDSDAENCPKRIARFQIQDAVTNLDGTELCSGTPNSCTTAQQNDWGKSDGFNYYNKKNPLEWQKDGEYDLTKNKLNVLVNYIEGFDLNSVNSNNKLAKITIVGNALRRSKNDFSCIDGSTYKNSPYCPQATAQVGGRSGFGTSE